MTYAPDTIRAARALLLANLDLHPTSHAYAADLDPDEVGVVGDVAHATKGTSYHLGKDQLAANAYSARTARDKAGLTDAASAIDIGGFSVTTPLGTFDLRHFTGWLFGECRKSAPDTLDLREVIGTLDGKTVLRWDAERGRASAPRAGEADASHLFHTHGSWYRDSEFRPKTPLFERYLREIGLLEDNMPTPKEFWDFEIASPGLNMTATAANWLKKGEDYGRQIIAALGASTIREQALATAVDALAKSGGVDSAPILAKLDALGAEFAERIGELESKLAEQKAEADHLRAELARVLAGQV